MKSVTPNGEEYGPLKGHKLPDDRVGIIYEDKEIIVCVKEAGVPVQSARPGVKDMVSILKNYRSQSEGVKGEPYVGVVHRLDQPVQGLLVFAKTKGAAASLSSQAAGNGMQKLYLAAVSGDSADTEGEIVDYLQKDGRTNTSRVVAKGAKDAKQARLSYRVLNRKNGLMLVEIRLHTGRHHQIRVQMANAGMPLYGDQKYGGVQMSDRTTLALCAYRLSFTHPKTGRRMEFTCTPRGSAFTELS